MIIQFPSSLSEIMQSRDVDLFISAVSQDVVVGTAFQKS